MPACVWLIYLRKGMVEGACRNHAGLDDPLYQEDPEKFLLSSLCVIYRRCDGWQGASFFWQAVFRGILLRCNGSSCVSITPSLL
jgi:hypothetical protein